jgi:hypothetical protein
MISCTENSPKLSYLIGSFNVPFANTFRNLFLFIRYDIHLTCWRILIEMITHLNPPGQNLQIAHEFLANQNFRLIMYKSLHVSNNSSLEAIYNYFAAQYHLTDRDVIAHLIVNENSANEILILRRVQGQLLEDSINERECNLFLSNRGSIDRMIAIIIGTELRA